MSKKETDFCRDFNATFLLEIVTQSSNYFLNRIGYTHKTISIELVIYQKTNVMRNNLLIHVNLSRRSVISLQRKKPHLYK